MKKIKNKISRKKKQFICHLKKEEYDKGAHKFAQDLSDDKTIKNAHRIINNDKKKLKEDLYDIYHVGITEGEISKSFDKFKRDLNECGKCCYQFVLIIFIMTSVTVIINSISDFRSLFI